MSRTPTNHKAWRLLDYAWLIFFMLNVLWAVGAINAKGGWEDWANWAWVFVSLWGVIHYWENLFGKRPT